MIKQRGSKILFTYAIIIGIEKLKIYSEYNLMPKKLLSLGKKLGLPVEN